MTLTDHLHASGIPIDDHITDRASELSVSLARKVATYLDTRFWITACEVLDGTSSRTDEQEIVKLLEEIVSAGVGFCPIAEPTFSELMKQGDVTQRKATATAVERLSLGVSFLPYEERMVAEAESLLLSRLSGSKRSTVNSWTRLPYLLCNLYPVTIPFLVDAEKAAPEAFLDRLWECPLVEIVMALDQQVYARSHELTLDTLRLSEVTRRVADQLTSFDFVREAEFHGLSEYIARHVERLSSLSSELSAMGSNPAMILRNAIRELLKDSEQARHIPTAHVDASMHALFRWEHRDKAVTAKDLVDFRHAAAALGHCTIMLTEASLRKALCHKRLRLDVVHNCEVLNDRSEIIHRLKGVLSLR